jgi:formate-dependent nitrite reductase membrane component NrfD
VALTLGLVGALDWADPVWRFTVPVLAALFLALTGALLIWDLEHPARFHFIFTRPQWRSWLVRGGVILGAYGIALGVHLLMSVLGWTAATSRVALLGAPLAVATAAYTAYLFAQAKARDLWQNPLAPVQLLLQAVLAGAGVLALLPMLPPAARPLVHWLLAGSCALHLLLLATEHTLTHATAHARLAAWEMTWGRYALFFWAGAGLVAAGVATPWLGSLLALPALLGLAAYEHAYVQAGQAVPLA